MGLGSKLKAVLTLDVSKFRRAAKSAKRELSDVDKQAKTTSATSSIGFDKMAMGVTAIGTAAVLAIGKIKDMSVAISKAADDAARIAQARSTGLAGELADPLYGQIADVTGWTEQEAYRRTAEGAKQYDLPPKQVGEAIKRIYSRAVGDKGAALETTMQFARARGASASAGELGGITPLLQKLYGMDTSAKLQQGWAELGEAAEPSAYTAGVFGSILGRVGPSMREAGMAYKPTLAYISGLSEFMPEDPMLAAGSLDILTRLKIKMPPEARKILAGEGVDLATANLDEIRLGMISAMRKMGVTEFASATNLDVRVLRGLMKTGTKMFQSKFDESMRGMEGAKWGDVEAGFKAKTGTTEAKFRRAAISSELPEKSFGTPGSRVEAVEMLKILQDRAAGGISREERLKFLGDINKAQMGMIPDDTEFTPEEALELQTLNSIYPRVMADLNKIASPERHRSSGQWTDRLRSIVNDLQARLTKAKDEANSLQKWGSQVDYLPEYHNVMREALRFIRRVGLGETIDALPGLRGTMQPIKPTAENMQRAGESEVTGSIGLGGGSTKGVTINNPQHVTVQTGGLNAADVGSSQVGSGAAREGKK